MKTRRIYNLVTIFLLIFLISCNINEENDEPYTFLNGNFETGDLTGWEIYGEAFKNNQVSFLRKDENNIFFNQEGDYFYYGYLKEPNTTGYMLSEPFILKGNGLITFLIGAGSDPLKNYVALVDNKGNELIKIYNEEFNGTNEMFLATIEASDYLGKTLRIKVVDNNDKDEPYNYLNVDGFTINPNILANVSRQLKEANKFIKRNKYKVDDRYRHTYHAMSELGWSNDPNGLVWYNDEFHLFYQYNPYQTGWGPMHWGHQTTKDFIKWENQPVALAPDKLYDGTFGAFSGTAFVEDETLYLAYTAVTDYQKQALAKSNDGINFTKIDENPIIDKNLYPSHINPGEVRDPKLFKKDGYYYIIIGAKTKNHLGQLLLYRSADMLNYTYVGDMMNHNNPNMPNFLELDGVYECPDYIYLDGKEVLISSPQGLPQRGHEFENIHSTTYMVGNLDFDTGAFVYDNYFEIDGGFDFYAPQTAKLPDGRTIMIAWMQMWDRSLPTSADSWVGSYTLPRELSLVNNKLYQMPVREIKNYRQNKVSKQNVLLTDNIPTVFNDINGKTIELELEFDLTNSNAVAIELFKGVYNKTIISYDKTTQLLTFDRSNSGVKIYGGDHNLDTRTMFIENSTNKIKLRIFLDISSVEIFVNDGAYTMSSLVYPDELDDKIEFYSYGGNAYITSLNKYDIIV